MNTRLTLVPFSLLFVLTFFLNCTQSSSHSRKPVTAIQIEPAKKSLRLGEELKINFQTKLKEGKLDKIELSIDGKVIQTSQSLTNSLVVKTLDFGVGKHIVRSSVYRQDGISGDNYEEFYVLSNTKPTKYSYQIVAEYAHDMNFFTQGFEFHNNMLYEGTGQEGTSAIYRHDLKNAKTQTIYKLENKYFAEGITILNNKIYQLTYKNRIGFVYDLSSAKLLNTWKYNSNEGWGLTNDGQSLIMSDGTEKIYFINPDTYREERYIQVSNDLNIIKNINELEYIKGDIWANIWQSEMIVIIDPQTGKVKGEIDLTGLSGTILQNQREQLDVLNGIAWNQVTDKIYVTGKLWPKIFEIKIIKRDN
jgi:glutamine cyclotransferase